MIPAALFYARIHVTSEKCSDPKQIAEVTALELGPDFFTFRVRKGMCAAHEPGGTANESGGTANGPGAAANESGGAVRESDSAEIGFGSLRLKGYRKVCPEKYRITVIGRGQYFDTYRFETDDEEFGKYAAQLSAEYTGYIRLRLTSDDAEMSQELTGYDVDEERFAGDFEAFRGEMFGGRKLDEHAAPADAERGIALSFPGMWERYLKTDKESFIREWFGTYAKAQVDARKMNITHIYFGSQFCMLRWPDAQITGLLDRAVEDGLVPVVVLAPMQEAFVELCRKRLGKMKAWCVEKQQRIEIVCGDLGLMKLVREICGDYADVTLGVMAVRHRKDTRRKWKIRAASEETYHTWIDVEGTREKLKREFGVTGASYEQCGDGTVHVPAHGWRSTVFMPYYQMNTSSMCTLYAAVENGERGRQVQNRACPFYCEEKCFLYPSQLHMAGIGNSLFGVDTEAWSEEKQIKGADRYVFNFM